MVVAVMMVMFSGVVFAEPSSETGQPVGGSVLPSTTDTVEDCQKWIGDVYSDGTILNDVKTEMKTNRDLSNFVLACGIKTGDIHLWMIPYYLRYILEFVIALAGLIAVGGIVYGGFIYIFSGISKDTEKGKKALIYSIIGLILTMVAWAVVNIVIVFLTQ